MWRFHTLLSFGISCFFSLALSALLCCFGSYDARATTGPQCYQWTAANAAGATNSPLHGTWSSAADAMAGLTFGCFSDGKGGCANPGTWTCSPDSATFSGETNNCTMKWSTGSPANGYTSSGSVLGACPPGPCAASNGQTVTVTVASGGPAAPGDTVQDAQGCQYKINTQVLNIVGCNGGCAEQQATGTGQQGTSGDGVRPVQSGSNCASGSNGTFCSEGSQGKNCGTFNGDEVCVSSIPPGTCESFASGGVACTAAAGTSTVTSPPAPEASGGTAATPSGSVQATLAVPPASGGGFVTNTTNYYSATTVAGSPTPVTSSAGGTNVGNAGSGSGTSSGTGSGPNAANGDCGASGVSCSGTVPSSASGDPWNGDCIDFNTCFQSFYGSVGQAPIISGAVAIEQAWPAGSCDIGSVSMETFGGKSFDYGATACMVWNNYISTPLSAILLAVYACIGIFIVLSA